MTYCRVLRKTLSLTFEKVKVSFRTRQSCHRCDRKLRLDTVNPATDVTESVTKMV